MHLVRNKKIPEELIKNSLSDIEKKTNKVAELNYKLSQIRIWSFISFKENWLDNNDHFKKKVKQIEFDFVYNINNKKINFDNPRIDKNSNLNVEKFIQNFNLENEKFFNKITFKNFVNNFFGVYAG